MTKNKLAVPYRCGDIQLVHGKGLQEVGEGKVVDDNDITDIPF